MMSSGVWMTMTRTYSIWGSESEGIFSLDMGTTRKDDVVYGHVPMKRYATFVASNYYQASRHFNRFMDSMGGLHDS